MSFLRTNYDDVNTGFEALPVGEYECFISKVTMKETSTKKPMLVLELTIRDDVEQEGKKRKFFDNLVVQENMMWKFQQIAKAADLPVGEDYASAEEFAQAVSFKPVRIKNKHEVYNDAKQDRVAFYMVSKVGGDFGSGSTGDPFGGGQINITDEDLPF